MNEFFLSPVGQSQTVAVSVLPGLTLAQHLYVAGAFRGEPLCSGAGRCGLCRTRFAGDAPAPLPEETARLGRERIEAGWRLSCRRAPVPGSTVEARLDAGRDGSLSAPGAATAGRLSGERAAPCPEASLGVDLGSTSVCWRFTRGNAILEGRRLNQQLGAGTDVMSRLALARHPAGADRLRRDVAEMVRAILAGLPCLPGSVCLAGNTCMTYLALGLGVSGLAAAPYRVDWPGGAFAVLDEALPEVYIPPLAAPFVGGDVTAGMAALEFGPERPAAPWLLADLGTNGEFVLALPDGRFLLASVPMGPALEGVGMARGMLAGPGAAVAFALSPLGLSPVLFAPAGRPDASGAAGGPASAVKGVSGTGYVSLAAKLLAMGALDESGRFVHDPASPLARRALSGLSRLPDTGEPVLNAGGAELFASDVEALLKVKAAFGAAVKALLDAGGLCFADLREVLLAGALGEHVSVADLETLGFFPPGGSARVRAVGNSSLDGACLAAARPDVREWLSALGARVTLVDVVFMPDFQNTFLHMMRFAHAR
jgi:uncharacterized 2Fe-2S/4Fe-4S cluster protein (DUF4445 family)